MDTSKLITNWFGFDRPDRLEALLSAMLAQGPADQLDAMGSSGLRISIHRCDDYPELLYSSRRGLP